MSTQTAANTRTAMNASPGPPSAGAAGARQAPCGVTAASRRRIRMVPSLSGARRLAAAVTLAVLAVLLLAVPASAHAVLESTDPPANARLDSAPSAVTLTFNEPVEVAVGAIRVLDAKGNRVDRGRVEHPDGDPRSVRVLLNNEGLSGGFAVGYRVTSADAHPVQGAFTFGVGTTTGDEAAAIAEELLAGESGSQAVGVAFTIVRWLAFAALVLLVGAAVFMQRLWPAGRGQRRVSRLVWGAWAALMVTTVASIGLQGAYAAGLPLTSAVDPLLFADVLATRYGLLALARIVLLILAIPLLATLTRPPRSRRARPAPAKPASSGDPPADAGPADRPAARRAEPGAEPATSGARPATPTPRPAAGAAGGGNWFAGLVDDLALLLGAGLLLTVALAGHAATGRLVPLAIVTDVVHLAAASIWIGGLVVLVVAVLPRREAAELGTVVPRFSSAAFACVAVLAASGTVQGWRQLGSIDELLGSTYGHILITKVIGVAALVGLGWASRRAVRRRLVPATALAARPAGPGADRADETGPAVAALRRVVAVEVVLGVVVLLLTSLLVNAVPARAGDDGEISFGTVAPGSPQSGAAGAEVKAGDTTVVVLVNPAKAGANEFHFSVLDASGQLVPVAGFEAELRLPSEGLGPIDLQLYDLGPGHYAAIGVQIPIKGTWQLTTKVRQSDIDEDVGVTNIQIR